MTFLIETTTVKKIHEGNLFSVSIDLVIFSCKRKKWYSSRFFSRFFFIYSFIETMRVAHSTNLHCSTVTVCLRIHSIFRSWPINIHSYCKQLRMKYGHFFVFHDQWEHSNIEIISRLTHHCLIMSFKLKKLLSLQRRRRRNLKNMGKYKNW